MGTAIVAIVVERCKAEFLLVEIDDAAGKVDAVDGIEEENEKLVVKSKLNPDTLVVASNVVGANRGNNSRCLVIFCPCFGGSNMVHMRNGGRRSISDVKVGDSVLAVDEMGQLRFSQVILQLHAEPEAVTEFQVIRTKTGRNLTLTPRHLIYKADNEIASSKPLFAMRIKKGDFV